MTKGEARDSLDEQDVAGRHIAVVAGLEEEEEGVGGEGAAAAGQQLQLDEANAWTD